MFPERPTPGPSRLNSANELLVAISLFLNTCGPQKDTILVRVTMTEKRHPDHCNSFKEKCLNGVAH